MEFASVWFIELFLPLTLVGYYLLRLIKDEKKRLTVGNIFLLTVSLLFYAWGGIWQTGLVLAIIAVNFVAGIWMEQLPEQNALRKAVFLGAIAVNVIVLVVFKTVGSKIGMLAISFVTFQSISYVADVYTGKVRADRKPLDFSLYMSLFAQMTQGPIMRYGDLGSQIRKRNHSLEQFLMGLKRFSYGLAKKVLIANVVAKAVDDIWAPEVIATHSTGTAWLGLILYALQIYYDFSGYTDMAIGVGGMFGFKITENFNYPYTALSVQEFWRRWHMSLSFWFRDYIYIPLGGSRCGKWRIYFNLFAVFFLTGIWHGTTKTFICWGLMFAGFSIIERAFLGEWLKKNPIKPLNWLYTMAVVLLGWVLFRAPALRHALHYFMRLIAFAPSTAGITILSYLNAEIIIAAIAGILCCGLIQRPLNRYYTKVKDTMWFVGGDTLIQLILFGWSLLRLVSGSYNPSIYGNF